MLNQFVKQFKIKLEFCYNSDEIKMLNNFNDSMEIREYLIKII